MKDTTAILNEIYPKIESKIKSNVSKYKQCVSRFMTTRSSILYSNAPCEKMYFSEDDIMDFYNSIGLDRKIVTEGISHTYYYEIGNFNPRYAKDDFVVSMMCIIRYFKLKNMKKELELAMIHLACSGKYYTSIFHGSFPVTDPQPHIMEYVVTNMATNKFDIVREGNVIGAIRSICTTWVTSYTTRFKEFHDDDAVYLIQQLHNRIRSFINNIAELYYDAHEHKDVYITYDSDSVSEDDYHIADSDSFRIERIVLSSMNNINSHGINYRICKMSSNDIVKVDELKSILEVLFSKNENIELIKEMVTLLVATYFAQSKTKDVRDISFITYSISSKPNSKNKSLLRIKELLNIMLLNNSEKFNRRRSRQATEQAYYRSMLSYFSLLIQESNK